MEKCTVTIKNCNCIKKVNLGIQKETLNIKFGINGTGKSTIGLAIKAKVSNDENELKKLLPYNSDNNNPEQCPLVSNLSFRHISVFNEKYANQYLFRGDNFFEDPFHVLLRSDECDKLSSDISSMLANLQDGFQKSEKLQQVRLLLPQLLDSVKIKNNKIAKNGGIGDLLKGNGCGFEKHKELEPYKDFYDRDDFVEVTKWAAWRRDGIDRLNGSNCPFCAKTMDMPHIEKQNEVIKHVFKNSAITTAKKVLDFLNNAVEQQCISPISVKVLETYLGDTNKTAELETTLSQLANETYYLNSKINMILSFKPMNVTREQLTNIEKSLDEMMIDSHLLPTFYCTEFIKTMICEINKQIENLKTKTGILKGLFMKYDDKLEELIQQRRDDINNFLSLAGFPYMFKIDPKGNQKALTYLVPISAKDIPVTKPNEHLSWGEHNAFSLVMFMFQAVSEDADLIVLDDPISSFDENKKFAIIQRMFDNQKVSFRDRTVLLLTHDTQPLIDCIKLKSFKKFGLKTKVNAFYLENEDGIISEQEITANDLKNIMILTENIVKDNSAAIAMRIINLRKLIELSDPQYRDMPIYHVLSNLIHGRPTPKYEDGITNLEPEVFKNGCNAITQYITSFDYDSVLEDLSDNNLKSLYRTSSGYQKILVARLILERDKNMFLDLRKKHPATAKYINETNHIENDFVFQLDPQKYYCIPQCFVEELDSYILGGYSLN
ncbi:MAG: hypothetical protein LKJ25_04705 [Clostridia bacterium]|jgi:energy-coupling factor transporter ATP-binding protein EcfA2|nr:hypothetical protein [Clostridia bacterium]